MRVVSTYQQVVRFLNLPLFSRHFEALGGVNGGGASCRNPGGGVPNARVLFARGGVLACRGYPASSSVPSVVKTLLLVFAFAVAVELSANG